MTDPIHKAGDANAKTTCTTDFYASTDTAIYVEDTSKFPPAPNYITIMDADIPEDAYVVAEYTGKTSGAFTGLSIKKGVPSAMQRFTQGSIVARRVTGVEHNAIAEEIANANARITETQSDLDEVSEDLATLKSDIDADNTQILIPLQNVVIPTTAWIGQQTPDVADHPFMAEIAYAGVTEDHFVSVVFDQVDAISGNFANVCQSESGVVRIYAKEQPSENITIATIIAMRGQSNMKGPTNPSSSDVTIHGFIIDETNSDPEDRITYTDASAGMSASQRMTHYKTFAKHCVLKNALRQFYVQENDWTKREDGTASGVSSGASLNGDFMLEIRRLWFKVTPLGDDKKQYQFALSCPPGGGWVSAHQFGDDVRENIYWGVFEGVQVDGKLRSIYSTTTTPTVSQTQPTFSTYAMNQGATYNIELPLDFVLRDILFTWLYGTCNLQTIARGVVDVSAAKAVGADIKLTTDASTPDLNTQGTAANGSTTCVLGGIANPFGNTWAFMGEATFNTGTFYFSIRNNDHHVITNGSAARPSTWRTLSGLLTTSGQYVTKMKYDPYFPFFPTTGGGSDTTHYADYYWYSAGDHCVLVGAHWNDASSAGLFCLTVSYALGNSAAYIGARLRACSLN